MRRFFIQGGLVALLLVLIGTGFLAWIGERGGLTPISPASPGAEEIQDLYVFVGVFATLIFLAVTVPLALFVVRFRARRESRELEGPQIRGHARLELAWVVLPVLILVAIGTYTLLKMDGIRSAPAAAAQGEELDVGVEAVQFYWLFEYPNGVLTFDRLHLPEGRAAHFRVTAPEWDVIHSFWVPALGGKIDAIPGRVTELEYVPTRTGEFDGKCAELCGIQHAVMRFDVTVQAPAEFDAWLAEQERAQSGPDSNLGQRAFEAVCSKCHFAAPEYAPNIAGSPLLRNRDALRQIITEGRGRMPPVGANWPERLLDDVLDYLVSLAPPEAS